jgi:anti-anti-sigma factor
VTPRWRAKHWRSGAPTKWQWLPSNGKLRPLFNKLKQADYGPAGTHLGPYEVLSPLGAGGMGEVYRACDTRLGREVTIKVLPVAFSQDADWLRRFEQEARAASALDHPNIITVHEIGEGPTLPHHRIHFGRMCSIKAEDQMQISEHKIGRVTVLKVAGEIGLNARTEQLSQLLGARLKAGDRLFVINLAECPRLDSLGLGELLRAHQTVQDQNGVLKLADVPLRLRSVILVANLAGVLEMFQTEQAAISSFGE